MVIVVNIKEERKLDAFLKLMNELDYVEIVSSSQNENKTLSEDDEDFAMGKAIESGKTGNYIDTQAFLNELRNGSSD